MRTARLLLLFTVGCAFEDEPELGETDQDLYVASNLIWQTNDIPVCWETGGQLGAKILVRDAVRATWEAESGVTFVGWETCTSPTTSGIRIRTADEWPHTKSLGRSLNGVAAGVVLNFQYTFRDILGNQPFAACLQPNMMEPCIVSTAVHEFGHVLGFAHEQDRYDTPPSCPDIGWGPNGNSTVGPFDMGSVMAYCNPNQTQRFLSPTDIWGVQKFYGSQRPVAATLRGWGQHDIALRTTGNLLQTLSLNDAASWQTSQGPGEITSAPSIVASAWYDVRAVVGGTDRGTYTKRGVSGTWGDYEGLSGQLEGNPVIASRGEGRYDVFVRAMDHTLFWRSFANGAWTDWSRIASANHFIVGTPSVKVLGNHIHVVARTLRNKVVTARYDGVTWEAWREFPLSDATSDPVVASKDGVSIDVFVRGTDDTLFTASRNATTGVLSSWTRLGGNQFRGTPAVVSRAPGLYDVFVRGTDNALYTKWFNGSGWLPFYVQLQSNPILASPTATTSSAERIDVFVRGTDNRLYQKTWQGHTGWGVYQGVAAATTFR